MGGSPSKTFVLDLTLTTKESVLLLNGLFNEAKSLYMFLSFLRFHSPFKSVIVILVPWGVDKKDFSCSVT